MTAPTGTFTGYAATGNREDLSDIIYDISPMDVPFLSNIEKIKATATKHEWLTDSLAAASASNAAAEGDDATTSTATPTSRFANYCQIAQKTPRVSGTQNAVTSAGRKNEMAYQIEKRLRELKRDVEKTLLGSQAATVGTAAVARKCGGAPAWLWANQRKQGTAATTITVTSGHPGTAPTAGTAATFLEADLKSVLKSCWDAGGNPTVILTDSFNKQLASAFSGIGTQFRNVQPDAMMPGVTVGAVDMYISDYGSHQIVADRYIQAGNVLAIDLDYWKLATLRDFQQHDLAKTGDSVRKQVLVEFTLEACNPSSSGKVYTNTTS